MASAVALVFFRFKTLEVARILTPACSVIGVVGSLCRESVCKNLDFPNGKLRLFQPRYS